MKWSNRIAQGFFSPKALTRRGRGAVGFRPEGAGAFLNQYLGLKPQARSYCPFGAETESFMEHLTVNVNGAKALGYPVKPFHGRELGPTGPAPFTIRRAQSLLMAGLSPHPFGQL